MYLTKQQKKLITVNVVELCEVGTAKDIDLSVMLAEQILRSMGVSESDIREALARQLKY